VKRNGNGDGTAIEPLLHDAMAAALADGDESIGLEDPANIRSR
jgi:hypothetical protein